MNSIIEFWNGLGDDKFFLIFVIVFFLCHLIFQIYRNTLFSASKKQGRYGKEEGVSVILTCSDKAELLKENLPAFLEQDYPDFEVIVVDECSEDETQKVLSDLQKQYPHLRTSRIFPDTKFRRTKKIAINIGVLAATHDILLFSEINARPESKNWIRTMQAYFDANTAVVLGYSNYAVKRGNAFRRYFRFLWFWRMLLMVRRHINICGNGYNMGYRKRYYLEKRGFTKNTQEYIGYDSDMVGELADKGSVRMVTDMDAHVVLTDDSKEAWKDDYSYHYATRRRWPWQVIVWSHIDFVVETLIYLLSVYFVAFHPLRKYFVIPLVLTFLVDAIICNVGARRLGLKKMFMASLVVNACGFVYKWYYGVCSVLNRKKWY